MPWFVIASNTPAGRATVAASSTVFVDVITEMHNEVDFVVIGDYLVGIEVAEGIIRTSGNSDDEPLKMANRECFRLAQSRGRAVDNELIKVALARLQSIDDLFDGVIALRVGCELAMRNNVKHFRISCHIPVDRNRIFRAANPGPDNDTRSIRITTGYPVRKH